MKLILGMAFLFQTFALRASDDLRLSVFIPTETKEVYAGELTNNSQREVHYDSTDAFRFELKTDEGWKQWPYHPTMSLPNWVRVAPNAKQDLVVRIPREVFSQNLPARVVLIVFDSEDTKIIHRVVSPKIPQRKAEANTAAQTTASPSSGL